MGVTPGIRNGFTLLEVMIALALIGLIFVGIGAIQKRQSNTQYHLEEQLAAAQVAHNLMEMFLAEGLPVQPEHLDGEETMAERLLPWTRQIVSIDDGAGHEVRIQVGPGTSPLFVERLRWSGREATGKPGSPCWRH